VAKRADAGAAVASEKLRSSGCPGFAPGFAISPGAALKWSAMASLLAGRTCKKIGSCGGLKERQKYYAVPVSSAPKPRCAKIGDAMDISLSVALLAVILAIPMSIAANLITPAVQRLWATDFGGFRGFRGISGDFGISGTGYETPKIRRNFFGVS
jgi:hypothetical protein